MNIDPLWWSVQDLLDVLFSDAALQEWITYQSSRSRKPVDEADWLRKSKDIRKTLGVTEADAQKVLKRIGQKVFRLDLAPTDRVFLVQKLIPALFWAASHKEGTRAGVEDVSERGGDKTRVTVRVPDSLLPAGMSHTEAILAGLELLRAKGPQAKGVKVPPKRL